MSLTPEEQIDLFRKLLLARRYEETLEQKKKEGYISSWLHLGTGRKLGILIPANEVVMNFLHTAEKGNIDRLA